MEMFILIPRQIYSTEHFTLGIPQSILAMPDKWLNHTKQWRHFCYFSVLHACIQQSKVAYM